MALYEFGKTFRWFVGRVININDPWKLGRVQLRMLNEQTGSLSTLVADEDLLWAYPISAIQSASLNHRKINELEFGDKEVVPEWIEAVGLSPTGIAVGSYVYGFYLDGNEQNIPLFFGTYHKLSRYPEPKAEETPTFHDVSELARGTQTLPKYSINETEFGRSEQFTENRANSASSNTSTDVAQVIEPLSPYKATYPYNTTYTTKSGHAIELDDTIGHERIHIWHKSGSYEEISSDKENNVDGQRVIKTTDNKWEIVIKDNNLLVKGNMNIEIDQNANVHIHGNINLIVDGNVDAVVHGNVDAEIDGNTTAVIHKNLTATVDQNTDVTTHGTTSLHSDGDFTITSDTHIGLTAPRIDLN